MVNMSVWFGVFGVTTRYLATWTYLHVVVRIGS